MTRHDQTRTLLETLHDYLPTPTHHQPHPPGATRTHTTQCPHCQGQGGNCQACHGKGTTQTDPYTQEHDLHQPEHQRTGHQPQTMTRYEIDRTLEHLDRTPTDTWTAAIQRRDQHWKAGSYRELVRVLETMRHARPTGFQLVWLNVICGGYGVPVHATMQRAIDTEIDWIEQRMPNPIRIPEHLHHTHHKPSLHHGRTQNHTQARAHRDHHIRWLSAQGWTTKDLAQKYNLSTERIRQIKRNAA